MSQRWRNSRESAADAGVAVPRNFARWHRAHEMERTRRRSDGWHRYCVAITSKGGSRITQFVQAAMGEGQSSTLRGRACASRSKWMVGHSMLGAPRSSLIARGRTQWSSLDGWSSGSRGSRSRARRIESWPRFARGAAMRAAQPVLWKQLFVLRDDSSKEPRAARGRGSVNARGIDHELARTQ